MRTKLFYSLLLCLGGVAGACGQASGSDPLEQADRNDAQTQNATTVQLALTGLT